MSMSSRKLIYAAALVPNPRVNLPRFHGVFAPHSKHLWRVTPAQGGKGREQAKRH